MFLTENYAALHVLGHYIGGTESHQVKGNEVSQLGVHTLRLKPYTLFGSSFPKDKEYTQVYLLLQTIQWIPYAYFWINDSEVLLS